MEKRVIGIVLTILGIIGLIYGAISFVQGKGNGHDIKLIVVAFILGLIFLDQVSGLYAIQTIKHHSRLS